MFGYVVPAQGELKVREQRDYQAVYCGLCHSLGKRYGFPVRFLLNYDFAFLAMVLAPQGEKPQVVKRRCIACPLRGKPACSASPSLDLAADASVILTYWKLKDNALDDTFWRKIGAKLLCFLLHPAYKKAQKLQPAFDQQVQNCLEELRILEENCVPSLDRPADTFARILSAVASDDRSLEQLLYHVGRWIYLVDAWDDLAQDRKEGHYNPLLFRYPDGPEQYSEEVRVTLKHSLNLALSAYHLNHPGHWDGVILNTLCLGLPMVEEAVFSGQWKQMKKMKRETKI